MAGDISFLKHRWMGSGAAVEYVMQFLADRATDSSIRDELNEMLADGVAFLHLRDPAKAELVDLIVDALPSHVAEIDDVQLRETLQRRYSKLYEYAREQQSYNQGIPGR